MLRNGRMNRAVTVLGGFYVGGLQQHGAAAGVGPARVGLADERLDAAVREVRGAHAGKTRSEIELQVPAGEIAPSREQDLVRKKLLHIAA